MDDDILKKSNPRNGRAIAGVILLIVGSVLLLQRFLPDNLEVWPLWLVGWGCYIGSKDNFHKPSSIMLVLLGGIFLITNNIHNIGRFTWPVAIIAFGLWMILRRNRQYDGEAFTSRNKDKWDWKPDPTATPGEQATDQAASSAVPQADQPGTGPAMGAAPGAQPPYRPTGDDYLDTVSVFGGVKKTILSKSFRGGEVVNIFGGAELDFTQADIQGRIIIDVTQIFGSLKLIVPSNWQVVPDIAAVFAGIEDKRMRSTAAPGNDKILVLKGVSIFAGVDIRSY